MSLHHGLLTTQALSEATDPPLPDEGHILYTMPDGDDEDAWRAWIRGNAQPGDGDPRRLPKSPSGSMLRLIPQVRLVALRAR